jgi:DmsE family decaheme c-type cytochrome
VNRPRWAFIPVLFVGVCALGAPARAVDAVPSHVVMLQESPPAPQPPPGTAGTPPSSPRPEETATATAEKGEATYVGADTCTACHDTVEAAFAHTPHGSAAFARLAPQGCESCHGPGSRHVDDPDTEELWPRVDRLPAKVVNAGCRTCHDSHTQFFWDGSVHQKRGMSCTSCHSVHAPQEPEGQLRMASVSEQCQSCHQQVRAETWKNSHHPIREGRISCTDCHNPHGGTTSKSLRADSTNDLCYSCHAEKRGPFLWEHAPVREDCMTCHTPHGSNHAKLQRVSVPYLCQQCHANTRHPGTLYDARNTPQPEEGLPVPINPSNRIFERACVNCHSAVHGSNHPSSPYLAH